VNQFLAFLLALLITGCNLGAQADRATYEAIAPEYEAYVTADPLLTKEQKERRHQTIRSWEAKLPPAGAQ
jgi:hypothetical protein